MVTDRSRIVKEENVTENPDELIESLGRRISVNGDFNGSRRRRRAASDRGDASQHRCIKITCTALLANPDRHVFEDDKTALVPQRLAIDSPFADFAATMFATEIL